jgi:predicted ArsR family transcriptional regulator
MKTKQTVYNRKMKRRSKLSKDILELLERQPNMTQAQIARELDAKPHSIKAVLWKLVNRQSKILATKGAKADTMTGPKVVNVYCLAPVCEGQPA